MQKIAFGKPIIGEEERELVLKVMESGMLVHGPYIERFEEDFKKFTGAPFAIAVANCTAALHLVYFALGIGPQDEVIVPAQTHVATAHAVELTGARAIFVDVEPLTGNIDIDKIKAAITSRTKAISVVHYLGLPVDMIKVADIARRHNLALVEDCALALGSSLNKTHVGLFGDAGCFSFYPVKLMTTSEGGMVITANEKLAAMIKRQRAFGMDKHVGERKVPGLYDVQGLGFNYRMSEIEAALGVAQLKRVPDFLAARKRNFHLLYNSLQGLEEIEMLQSSHDGYESSYYCLPILLKEPFACRRQEIISSLNENGVGTSIYYPHPVPLMSYYANRYGYKREQFPVAARISDNSIALPVGPHLNITSIEYIAEQTRAILAAFH